MEIKFDKRNYRKHSEQNKKRIKKSLKECGAGRSVLVDADDTLIAGNGVFEQAQAMGIPTRVVETDGTELVVVKRTDLATDDPKRKILALADNATSDSVEWDMDNIDADFSLDDIADDWGVTFATEEIGGGHEEKNSSLSDRFVVPPFSILDARKGYWQERKTQWRNFIQDNGITRENKLGDINQLNRYGMKVSGVSLLDPVLCEIIYKWFGVENCKCFDTFAGDVVFGYVASTLGGEFTGIEIRQEQVDVNNQKIDELSISNCTYICDDGQNICQHIEEDTQDLFFSCPPYYNLEVYSDKENDASNQDTYEDFMRIIENAFTGAIKCLKEDRFAVIVCGDIRDKNGAYYCFPDDIKRIFVKNGCVLYNDIILIDPVGSAIYRAKKYMKNRKVVKTHQNVLVFYKGNTNNIKKIFNTIEYNEDDLITFKTNDEREMQADNVSVL